LDHVHTEGLGSSFTVSGRKALLVSAMGVVLLLFACGGERAQQDSSPPCDDGAVVRSGRQWLAVFQTEQNPNRADALTRRLVADFGRAAVTAPAACFRLSTSAEIAPGAYVVGLVAATKRELLDKVEQSGIEPSFMGRVRDTCGP
jgi:hypothetical protein